MSLHFQVKSVWTHWREIGTRASGHSSTFLKSSDASWLFHSQSLVWMKKPEEISWTTTNHSVKWRKYKPKFMPDRTPSRRRSSSREQSWSKNCHKAKNHRHKNTTRLALLVNSQSDKFASQYFQRKIKTILSFQDVVILVMVALAAVIQDRSHSQDLINSHARRRWNSMGRHNSRWNWSNKCWVRSRTRLTSSNW